MQVPQSILSQIQPTEPLTRRIARGISNYLDDPVGFAEDYFGVDLDAHQRDALAELALYDKVAIASCTGAGKTTLAALAILWYFFTRPLCNIILTAPSASLLNAVLWKEVNKWLDRAPALKLLVKVTETRIRHRKAPKEWFIICRTTAARKGSDDSGSKQSEGLAGMHAPFMLFVLDEASGIERTHFETAEATLTGFENKILALGNPVRIDGRFFEIFDSPIAGRYWRRFAVSGLPNDDAPVSTNGRSYVARAATATRSGVSKKYFHQLVEEFGERSIVVQAKVFGRFPTGSMQDTGFTIAQIKAAFARYEQMEREEEAEIQIGIDGAHMGGDTLVAKVRQGYKELEVVKKEKCTTPEFRDLIGMLCDKYPDRTRPEFKNKPLVVIDEADAGGGGGTVELCHERGWLHVTGVLFGEQADEPDQYFNKAAEMWLGELRLWMPYLGLIEDKKLLNQLVGRRYEFVKDSQQRRLEPKKNMKRRAMSSPDEADATCLMITQPSAPGVA